MSLTVQIKVCARLKVCNWLARHVRNSQMSMKFKEAGEVKGCVGLYIQAIPAEMLRAAQINNPLLHLDAV